MTDEILQELHACGFDDLRPAHIRLAQHFDENGSRITDLAKRAQLTKQTVVHTVNDLERLGYAYRASDPADARAKLVLMTERGRQSIRAGEQIAARIEQRWARLIGKRNLHTLRELLLGLTNALGKETGASP